MMHLVGTWYLTSLLVVSGLARLNNLNTIESYMDICILGTHHKTSPSQEKGLTSKICSPWAARSCCTEQTALDIHTDSSWLNFDYNHCGEISSKCREAFLQDACFYACSPNVGPWLVQDVRKIRKERFHSVPLCKQDCDNWYEACKDDLTCTDDWANSFNWSSGANKCPQGSTCRKFSEVFENKASNMCEKVFGSYKVAPEGSTGGENCFHLWFDPRYPNPNEAVARRRAAEILHVEYKPVEGAKLTDHNRGTRLASVWGPSWLLSVLLVAVLKRF